MAANETLLTIGAALESFCFRDSTDFGPAIAFDLRAGLTPTFIQLDLTSLAAGSYRQSAKADLTTPWPRMELWSVIEPTSAPAAGGAVEYWWSPSPSSTAANANMGGASGVDAAYNGYGAAASDADEAVGELIPLGRHVITADSDISLAKCDSLIPPHQYGSLIVKNNMSVALIADAVEVHIMLIPLMREQQP